MLHGWRSAKEEAFTSGKLKKQEKRVASSDSFFCALLLDRCESSKENREKKPENRERREASRSMVWIVDKGSRIPIRFFLTG